MKKLVIGILAHVDAGKTTLSEGILYASGSIRKVGRVDNQDAFLDTYELERARGITIFSKQAVFNTKNFAITLLDTPGHVDFSSEMERTLQVLDYAILVISANDGVQGHTQTLWRLLKQYRIPTFIFVNKMDQVGADRDNVLAELRTRLDGNCIGFNDNDNDNQTFYENIAMCDDKILEMFLEEGTVCDSNISALIIKRKLFPCFFGSALKLEGITEFVEGIDKYMQEQNYGDDFGARIYKIARDEQGNRLTYMKVTGGKLKVKDELNGRDWIENTNQIRIYSGEKYELVSEALAGIICAVTGLSQTHSGEGLGIESESCMPLLEPVLTYKIYLPEGCEAHSILPKLKQLEEEDPQLHIEWNENIREIHAQIMGDVQIEVLSELIYERFGIKVEFGAGNIVYRETITDTVEGVGHFEPLRHYAEVHLLLEPGEAGSGIVVQADCSEDVLDRNWQRLILTHIQEKEHRGVLTGSPITDMKITLVSGRAHQKHTEGGDFRQATYRAVRHGLRQAKSVLLEPYYEFRLEVPEKMIGKAMTDIEKMHGTFDVPQSHSGISVLTGSAPVSTMNGYQKEVISYTKGYGRLFCTLKGYEPCHNCEEIIEKTGYIADNDLDNTADSVFCTHGSGFMVNWKNVQDYMHMESILTKNTTNIDKQVARITPELDELIGEDEIEAIFNQTFYANRKDKSVTKRQIRNRRVQLAPSNVSIVKKEVREEYFLVDGYNVIYAWEELKQLADINMDSARGKLLDILCNYQGMRSCNLIVVFDAYRVKGHETEMLDYHNIHVVYTKEAETADGYIEKFAHENGRKYNVTVVTSDGLEQIIIRGQGCSLISSREFEEEVERVNAMLRERYLADK